MKSFLLYILAGMWCISLSSGISLYIDKTNRRPELNVSKYIYHTLESDNTTDDAPYAIDICNMSLTESRVLKLFKKRSTEFHYETVTVATEEEVDVSIFSPEFKNCSHTSVEPECYQILRNGSVYVPLYNRLFDRRNYLIKGGVLYVCPHFFDEFEEKFSSSIETVSLVGVSISTGFIILHVIMFFVVEKLRNLPGYCLFSLCISLLIAYMCAFIQRALHEQANCKVIGMLLLYSFLSSFFWMNVISYDVWRGIRLALALVRLSVDTPIVIRFGLYSAYAWGGPLLIIIVAVIIDSSTTEEIYKLIFRVSTCWFQYKQALLAYFVVPQLILLVLNIFFFVSSFYMITKTTIKRSDGGSQVRSDLSSRLLMSLRLGTAMGFMWFFGALATLIELEWMFYLHSICNALQGVFIFFSFSINDRTKEAIQQKKKSLLPKQSHQSTTF